MEAKVYTTDEVNALRMLFGDIDSGRGRIHINQLPSFLSKIGKDSSEILAITEAASKVADNNEGEVGFNDIIAVMEKIESAQALPIEGPDPKVFEFLRILEEYRVKCEEEGNYLEAARAHKQLAVLRKQEEKRQQKAVRARQIAERQDVQLAHNLQFADFNRSWDRYMEEYDRMAQSYIRQMTERHASALLEFQQEIRKELTSKPVRWSRELLEKRRKQHVSARNRNYAEAQKLKRVCDQIEEKERTGLEQGMAVIFARREAKFRIQQQAELQALLKRIECRRKEHVKQRAEDTKRLLQRNRNVQSVLESKQNMESHKKFESIKKSLKKGSIFEASQNSVFGSSQIQNTGTLPPINSSSMYSAGASKVSESAEINDFSNHKVEEDIYSSSQPYSYAAPSFVHDNTVAFVTADNNVAEEYHQEPEENLPSFAPPAKKSHRRVSQAIDKLNFKPHIPVEDENDDNEEVFPIQKLSGAIFEGTDRGKPFCGDGEQAATVEIFGQDEELAGTGEIFGGETVAPSATAVEEDEPEPEATLDEHDVHQVDGDELELGTEEREPAVALANIVDRKEQEEETSVHQVPPAAEHAQEAEDDGGEHEEHAQEAEEDGGYGEEGFDAEEDENEVNAAVAGIIALPST